MSRGYATGQKTSTKSSGAAGRSFSASRRPARPSTFLDALGGPRHARPSAPSRLPPHASDLPGRGGPSLPDCNRCGLTEPIIRYLSDRAPVRVAESNAPRLPTFHTGLAEESWRGNAQDGRHAAVQTSKLGRDRRRPRPAPWVRELRSAFVDERALALAQGP